MTFSFLPLFLSALFLGFVSQGFAADTNVSFKIDFLTKTAEKLLKGCQSKAQDGTMIYTPDGKAYYRCLWTRDFTYMLEYAGDLMPLDQVESCVVFLLKGQREDGAMPDRVRPDGVPVYTAGPEGSPVGQPNLDNPMFVVIAVDEFLKRTVPEKRTLFFQSWSNVLDKAMDWIPRGEHGLVYNNPEKPHSPYGFTDCIGKTGELFMESLLYWTACKRLEALNQKIGSRQKAKDYARRAQLIEKNANLFFKEEAGAFLAATKDCRQIDIWANAYAIYLKFPLGQRRESVLKFLVQNYHNYVWRGQVRHLLAGEYWERLLAGIGKDRYQNGAYWATASGWVMVALNEKEPTLARQMFDDLIAAFQQGGVHECVHTSHTQLDSYVVSATNPLGIARQLFR